MPPSPPVRHLTLDALRGIAVMGILAMNIIAFSMPQPAYINPLAWGGTSAADLGMWAVNFILVDGKMRGLFSLLFGASMLLVIDGAEAKGLSGGFIHARRMLWLMIFGLIHLYLIWYGDILFLYAVVGLIAYGFSHKDAPALLRLGIGLILTSFVFWAIMGVALIFMQHGAMAADASAGQIASYRGMIASIGAPDTAPIHHEIEIYRGSYTQILANSLAPDNIDAPLTTLLLTGLETLGLMLIGMALLRNGFLTGQWSRSQYRSVAIRAYLCGLPPMIALCLWCLASGFDPVTTFNAVLVWSTPFRIIMVIAHAALALSIILARPQSRLLRRIAAAGRVAFTNYLGTSIAMTALFYGYGLGLFGHVSRFHVYGFVLIGWAVMLWWSKPWLERFAYGPLEWLWRSLARGKIQSMRRTAPN
nr:DUF418 domain-containing protein [Sphingobium boeckii]